MKCSAATPLNLAQSRTAMLEIYLKSVLNADSWKFLRKYYVLRLLLLVENSTHKSLQVYVSVPR